MLLTESCFFLFCTSQALFFFPKSLFVAFQFLRGLLDQLMAIDQLVHGAHGWKADGLLGTGIETGDTGHHAVQRGQDTGFFFS